MNDNRLLYSTKIKKGCQVYKQMIAEIIRKQRISQGITQRELAERSGFTLRSIQYWEKGTKSISLENADKLFKALGIEITIGG